MSESYKHSIQQLSASRDPRHSLPEVDSASLAEYERQLHQLAKTPVPREPIRPDAEVESADQTRDQ
jgi:hypothetical protein